MDHNLLHLGKNILSIFNQNVKSDFLLKKNTFTFDNTYEVNFKLQNSQ